MSTPSIQHLASDLSKWVDEATCNEGRDSEALTWHRVAKVAEEAGEAVSALIVCTGGNPRKQDGVGDQRAVVSELLDTALAALGAVEHLTGNKGESVAMLHLHALAIATRAGLR